ncbi:uncharacterized protein PHACADRAFT_195160 [Phanerochaete carnosa HHB-10118-sp]|uniref:NADP-dependent oxidoreductase domain-containing protein n=1 Tax=Phanerochaete carnosa (strain HHB-10118-sp) TaxID=650164 RepID=K5VUD0_PHACS|nr:uncharacterized protein PHACADRAFT_195160 [Phanerochaete carnosa HHB-10118-sp]EKM55133.1 hypothetical protein PHACADRAFT_195160 [Phanerochaete carnosa HHB-10118-sp]
MSSLRIALNDGIQLPWLAFGSGTALWQQDAAAQVEHAIRAGFVHIDTAQMYQNEDSVGRGIARSGALRGDLYVTTKLDRLLEGANVHDSLVDSLRKLGLDYVDLFLVHMPVDHPSLKDTWAEMEQVKEEGLAKSIGVSNFQPRHLDVILESAKVVPAVNQIEYNPYLVKASQPVLDYCKEHGIAVAAFGGLSPLSRFSDGPVNPILKKVAARLRKDAGKLVSEAQILQLWLRKKNIVCITTSSKKERLAEYVAVGLLPDITDAEEREIDEAGSQVHHRVWATWIDEGL